MNVLDLIKRDHAEVKELFNQFEAGTNRDAVARKILEQLPAHDHAEEQTVYTPASERAASGEKSNVAEAFEEHQAASRLIKELHGLNASDRAFESTMNDLIAAVRTHIEHEEGKVHPVVREHFDEGELDAMGKAFEERKKAELAHAG